jgi:hypothetical protein
MKNALRGYVYREREKFGCRNQWINNTPQIFIAVVLLRVLQLVLSVSNTGIALSFLLRSLEVGKEFCSLMHSTL